MTTDMAIKATIEIVRAMVLPIGGSLYEVIGRRRNRHGKSVVRGKPVFEVLVPPARKNASQHYFAANFFSCGIGSSTLGRPLPIYFQPNFWVSPPEWTGY